VAAVLRNSKTRLIGPNCPGIISPGKMQDGDYAGADSKQGNIGVVSRSGTLTYEAVHQLTQLGIDSPLALALAVIRLLARRTSMRSVSSTKIRKRTPS